MKTPFIAVVFAVLASCIVDAGAGSAPASHVLHEERQEEHSRKWVKQNPVNKDFTLPVQFALTQTNLDIGSDMLLDISDPTSSNYGKHYSMAEIARLFAPSPDSINAVTSWIQESLPGKKVQLSPSLQWLQINATIADLQDLLHAEYHEYEHFITGNRAIGCDKYHVPKHIHQHLDFVKPGVVTLQIHEKSRDTSRGAPGRHNRAKSYSHLSARSSSNDTSLCGSAVTAACVRAIYNITDKVHGNSQNSIGVYETYDEYFNQTDLNDYFKKYAPEIPQGTGPEIILIDGAPAPNYTAFGDGQEAALDFQAVFPLVYPDKVINYQIQIDVGNGSYTGIFNTFLDALDKSYCNYTAFGETGDLKGVDPPYPQTQPGGYDHPEQCGAYTPSHVISISYNIDENSTPMNYQRRQCNEWMKLGLQGVSVIVSSGDTGVESSPYVCEGNNTLFEISGPSNCPWITSVGGTGLPPDFVPGKTAQVAATDVSSGGGFSNIFPTAKYQQSAVDTYFKNSPPPYPYYNITYNATHTHGYYNRGGRGIPDVAAIAQTFPIFTYQTETLASGTSLSAPIFAGMIARINSFRLDAGKKPVGFLNPTLYAHPHAFQDVISGDNPGCDTKGFSAVQGWDPVTGLGTPNYGLLKDVFMSLP